MAEYTPFAGLYSLDPGEPISQNGYEFYSNERTTDQYIGAFLTHRHNGAAAMSGFASNPTATPSASGGTLPGGDVWYIGVTALDQYGGETMAVSASTTTSDTVANPTSAPAATASGTGTLRLGAYRYGYTLVDANGETMISPQSTVSLPTNGAALITMPVTTATKRVYRAFGYGDFHKVSDVAGSATLFRDDGSLCVSCDQNPPDENTAGAINKITITRPTLPTGAVSWRAYASDDPSFISPAALYAYGSASLREIPSGTTSIDFTDVEQQRLGSPPPVSRTIPGASLLYASDLLYEGGPLMGSGTVEAVLDRMASAVVYSLGASGVTASGHVTLLAGANISITPSAGSAFVISASGGGGGSVTDAVLSLAEFGDTPMTGHVKLVEGANIQIVQNTAASSLTISSGFGSGASAGVQLVKGLAGIVDVVGSGKITVTASGQQIQIKNTAINFYPWISDTNTTTNTALGSNIPTALTEQGSNGSMRRQLHPRQMGAMLRLSGMIRSHTTAGNRVVVSVRVASATSFVLASAELPGTASTNHHLPAASGYVERPSWWSDNLEFALFTEGGNATQDLVFSSLLIESTDSP